MKNPESVSIYDGATDWKERRAREAHQLAMQRASVASHEVLVEELAKMSGKLDEIAKAISGWTVEVHSSSSDIN